MQEIFSTSVTEVFWYPKMQGKWNFSWEVSDPSLSPTCTCCVAHRAGGSMPPCCPTRIAEGMDRLCRAVALVLLAVLCGRANPMFQMESQWDRLFLVLLGFCISQKALKCMWSSQRQLIYISDRTRSLYCRCWAGAEIQFLFRKILVLIYEFWPPNQIPYF